MRSDEAKFVLSAFRPRGEDADEPQMTRALLQAGRDPELLRWLDEAREFDLFVASKLEESMPVPAELRTNIRIGAQVGRSAKRSVRLVLIGTATAMVLVGSFGLLLPSAQPLEGWQQATLEEIAGLTSGQIPFDEKSNDLGELQDWLKDAKAPNAATLPPGLSRLGAVGCKTLSWDNQLVSIICFGGGKAGLVHLVIVDRQGPRNAPRLNAPRWIERGAWLTATWSSGDQTYMLAMQSSRAALKALL
jgi:hypothetical protein